MKFTLFDYQKEGVKWLVSGKRRLLADGMGLGKSCQTLEAINVLRSTQESALNVLIVCPAALVPMWVAMCRGWFDNCEVHELAKSKKIEFSKDIRIGVVSYHYMQKHVDRLIKVRWDVVVLDEAHAIKSLRSKTCKSFRILAEIHQGHLWMLTGTPATRSGQDYYIYLKVLMGLDMGYREFSDTYCIREWNPWRGGFDYKGVKDGKQAKLRKLFSGIMLRRRKEEVLKELPPKLISEVPCEVDAAIVAECAQVGEETVRTCLAEGVGIPAHIMKVIRSVGMGKVGAAVEIIENTDEPIVVMAIHKDVVSAICEKVGGVRVTGDESAEQKNQAVADFQSGKERIIVCNVAAGGVGITLTAATQMLFVELPWSPAVMRQAEDRIHRIGAKGCSNIIRLIANNTVDKQILDVLAYKERFMTSVMGDMK